MRFSLEKLPVGQIIAGVMLVGLFLLVGFGKFLLEKGPSVSEAISLTPTLRGEGDLPDLHDVIKHDPILEQMVKNLASVPAEDIFVMSREIDPAIVDILFRWAGVSQVRPEAYGPHIDGRVAAFIERAGAIPKGTLKPQMEIGPEDALRYNRMWSNAFYHFRLRLLAQTAGRAVYSGQIEYSVSNSKIVATGPVSAGFIERFRTALQGARNSGESMRNFLDFVDATKGFENLSPVEQNMIMSLEKN